MKNKLGIEIFEGFGISYPEYEVITPQTKKSYTIRSLNVSEEEVLKGSMVTPSKLPRHIAEVLWKCIVKKPDEIKTFDDFINCVTIDDRDALLYGLYVSTYKDVQNYTMRCDCGFENLVKVNMENCLKIDFWDDSKGSILKYYPKVDFKIFDGVHCFLKIPSLKDEIVTSEKYTFNDNQKRNLAIQLLRIQKFTQDPNQKLPQGEEICELDNIIKAYNSLPSNDRKLINEKYNEEFSNYQVKVLPKVKCQKCGKVQEVEIDIYQQFFRSLF